MLRALTAEIVKLKRSRILMWTVLTVIVWPSVTDIMARLGGGSREHVTWEFFMHIATQQVASWYGVPLFGLVAAYLFGREFGEQTARNLLTLPVRREYFMVSKLIVMLAWVFALAVLSVAVHAGYAAVLGLRGFAWDYVGESLGDTLLVTLVIACTLPFVGWLAMIGRGYLAPMLFSLLAFMSGLVLLQTGAESWFPWSMPLAVTGINWFPGSQGTGLETSSWVVLIAVFAVGVAAILVYIDWADNLE